MSTRESMRTVNILCMKWGTKFGPEFVNKLASMVSRHLHRPYRFICLTDNDEGLAEGIEVFPIPDLDVDFDDDPGRKRVQAWKKLLTFKAPLYDIEGACLFLDLDLVIVDDIDCFFESEGEFFIIKDWGENRNWGNSSVYRFEIGSHDDILPRCRP